MKEFDKRALRAIQEALKNMDIAIEALENGAGFYESIIDTPLQDDNTILRTNIREDAASSLKRERISFVSRTEYLIRALKK